MDRWIARPLGQQGRSLVAALRLVCRPGPRPEPTIGERETSPPVDGNDHDAGDDHAERRLEDVVRHCTPFRYFATAPRSAPYADKVGPSTQARCRADGGGQAASAATPSTNSPGRAIKCPISRGWRRRRRKRRGRKRSGRGRGWSLRVVTAWTARNDPSQFAQLSRVPRKYFVSILAE